jgi:hypothetical protein
MDCEQLSNSMQPEGKLQAITDDIRNLANHHRGNSRALLALLRALEQTHREIQEDLFQSSLPSNRQELYALLKDIEDEGGWPYIERMKLRSLLSHLAELGMQTVDEESDE